MIKKSWLAAVLLFCAPFTTHALSFVLDPNSDIVGEIQSYTVQKGDTFAGVARRFDLGIIELQEANPKIDASKKLEPGTEMIIPTAFILPTSVPHDGLILNVAELRIYYFPPNTNMVMTFPVGLGKTGWRTPIGETTIVAKRENPTWIPPASLHAEAARQGYSLPAAMGPGPNNPLGKFAMNLGWGNYRIHGTNKPESVGLRSSHGCIRMLPEDVDSLFNVVEVGTKVYVIHEPFKVGVRNGELYLEAHEPFPEQYYNVANATEDEMLQDGVVAAPYTEDEKVNWSVARKLINDTYGYPVRITNLPVPEAVPVQQTITIQEEAPVTKAYQ